MPDRNRQEAITPITHPDEFSIEERRQFLCEHGIDLSRHPDWLVDNFLDQAHKHGIEDARMTYEAGMNMIEYDRNLTPQQREHYEMVAKQCVAEGLVFPA